MAMLNNQRVYVFYGKYFKKYVCFMEYIYIYEMYIIQFMWDMNVKYCEQLKESSWFHSELITS